MRYNERIRQLHARARYLYDNEMPASGDQITIMYTPRRVVEVAHQVMQHASLDATGGVILDTSPEEILREIQVDSR